MSFAMRLRSLSRVLATPLRTPYVPLLQAAGSPSYLSWSRTEATSRTLSSASQSAVGGFSQMGPKKLSDIAKLQLLERHGSGRVTEIWGEHHASSKTAMADVLSKSSYELFQSRTKRCPLFVIAVPRDVGYFTLLVQFQGRMSFLTFLDDYKKNAATAMPYLSLTFFEDFVSNKSIALMRGDVTNMMSKTEAKV